MGESIMARRYRAKLAAERLQERLQADEAAIEELARFRAEWLDRGRAAAALGIRPRTLKQWQLEGRGPAPVKLGDRRQSRCLWAQADIDSFLSDPAGYEARKHAAGDPAGEAVAGEPVAGGVAAEDHAADG